MHSEELAAQLTKAREELEALLGEQRNIGGEMQQARLADAEARVNAPGGIRGAIASAVSRVRGVQDRAEQLPHEIWSAQLHVLALERDYQQALYDELAEPEARLQAEFRELDEELPKLQRRRQDALDHSVTASWDRRAA
jgi:chromosome segregation ATPase